MTQRGSWPGRASRTLKGRGFVLFPAAAYAVHQLRYELGYGSGSASALAAQGHGYLDSLAPWIAVLLALGMGSFLTRVARAASGRPGGEQRRSFAGLAALAWGLLFAAYAVQEWLEGIFAAGHPAGLAGIFGHGGWWAIPLAGAAALVVAALLRFASVAIEVVSKTAVRIAIAAERASVRPAVANLIRLSPLARRVAGRAPPGTLLAARA
jgi:hypothetical protein